MRSKTRLFLRYWWVRLCGAIPFYEVSPGILTCTNTEAPLRQLGDNECRNTDPLSSISKIVLNMSYLNQQQGWEILSIVSHASSHSTLYVYWQVLSFLHTDTTQVFEIHPPVRQGPTESTCNGQYHGCWYPGVARSPGMSNLDIDKVKRGWLGPRSLRVN